MTALTPCGSSVDWLSSRPETASDRNGAWSVVATGVKREVALFSGVWGKDLKAAQQNTPHDWLTRVTPLRSKHPSHGKFKVNECVGT